MWVEVDGGRLYVEVAGHGAPLVLLHGWPLDHRMFNPQLEALTRNFTVVTLDRRGFGQSEAQPDLHREPDDIDRILDALQMPTAHLLGMSQGGRIALRYAVTRPQRLRSLLLQGAVIDGFAAAQADDEPVPLAEFARLARAGRLQAVKQRWLQHPLMQLPDGFPGESRLLEEILADYTGADLIGFDADCYSFAEDVLSALAHFSRPTLLLTGARETASRRLHAAELLRRLPDCREQLFANSGHLSNLTEAPLYNRTVIDFCRGSVCAPDLSARSTDSQ